MARDGKQALAAALRNKPDMVVTDVVMPEMDGYTLCKEITSRNIDWRIGSLPSINCDPGVIPQVFANLLSNAI